MIRWFGSIILFLAVNVMAQSGMRVSIPINQPTLYLQPGGSGRFSTTPPPSSGAERAPRAPWDGGISVVPESAPRTFAPSQPTISPKSTTGARSSNPSPNNSDGGNSGLTMGRPEAAPSGSRMGVGIEVDIAGGRELARNIEAAKAYEEYIQWLGRSSSRFNQFFKIQPRFAKQLRTKGYAPKYDPVFSADVEQNEIFDESGEGLVMVNPTDRAGAGELMRSLGVEVSTGSSAADGAFADAYERFREQEVHYHRQLIQEASASTLQLGRDVAEDVRRAERAVSDLVEINSEFSSRLDEPAKPLPESFMARARNVDDKIERIDTSSPQGSDLKSVARSAYRESLSSMGRGETEDADWYLKVAEGVADLALGIDPFTGFYRSLVESVTGYNIVTREKLSSFERGLAVFGVLTAGSSSSIQAGFRLISRLGAEIRTAEKMIHAAQAAKQNMDKFVLAMQKVGRMVHDWGKFPGKGKHLENLAQKLQNFHEEIYIEKIYSAGELNVKYLKTKYKREMEEIARNPTKMNEIMARLERPYHSYSYAVKGPLKERGRFIRFSEFAKSVPGSSGPMGQWVARPGDFDLNKMTPVDIKRALSLEYVPGFATEVNVPAGTMVLRSETSAAYRGTGGTVQYEILDELQESFFGPTRKLK